MAEQSMIQYILHPAQVLQDPPQFLLFYISALQKHGHLDSSTRDELSHLLMVFYMWDVPLDSLFRKASPQHCEWIHGIFQQLDVGKQQGIYFCL